MTNVSGRMIVSGEGMSMGSRGTAKERSLLFSLVLLPLLHNCHLLYTVDAGVVSVML